MPLNYIHETLAKEHPLFDTTTGLKTQALLHHDTHIELDRVARGGEPFSFALLRIDNRESILKNQGDSKITAINTYMGTLIRESLRIFDDAYILENGDFALCLKLARISGGLRAIERIREGLEKSGHVYTADGQEHPLTISCCVAEPLHDEDLDDLINNLSQDLDSSQSEEEGQVFSYKELSPLQRYAQNQD